MSYLQLGVDAEPHDELNDTGRVKPPQSIAFLTNWQVVLQIRVAAPLHRHHMVSLPTPAGCAAADMATTTGDPKDS